MKSARRVVRVNCIPYAFRDKFHVFASLAWDGADVKQEKMRTRDKPPNGQGSAAASALHKIPSKTSDLAREAVGWNPLFGGAVLVLTRYDYRVFVRHGLADLQAPTSDWSHHSRLL